ncbi:putative regulator protein [Rhodobacterales bacterium HTCC2150]|nr:putative regulator protein [Rhodobacterales bacterium HTCC2150] [Rhodobacteraceae bacterium HTCC2150]
MIHLHLSASWKLTLNGEDTKIRSRKGRALLTYLALSGGSARRETLAELLWDSGDIGQARTSLRQVISNLRRSFKGHDPDLFQTTPDEVSIPLENLSTDLDEMMQDLTSEFNQPNTVKSIQALPQLMSELDGISSGFDDWLATTRSHTLSTTQNRLRTVYSKQDVALDVRNRASHAALLLNDLDEHAARALMECHVQAGNSALALRVYGNLHARLEEELDAEPSQQTLDLVVAIKLEKNAAPDAPVKIVPVEVKKTKLATVAVLPFDFFGPEPTPEYLALGLLDQITCHLASYRAPAVISSNSTRGYRGQSPDLNQIRRDIDPTYVVTGSVLLQKGEASVSVQLVEAKSSLVLWAGSFVVASDTVFSVRQGVAESIARTLMPNVNLAELRTTTTQNDEALGPYHLVLRAKDLIFQLETGSFELAGGLLMQAVTIDPTFAAAHALLGEWYALRIWQGWSKQPDADRRSLELHVKRAVALAPGDGRIVSLMGHCRMMFDQRHNEALTLFDQAIELTPNDAETLAWSVPTLAYSDQADRGVAHGKRVLELSPLDPFIFRNEHFLSIALFMTGDYDGAAEKGLSCYRRAPDYSSNIRMTIAALQRATRLHEIEPLIEHHANLMPDFSVTKLMQGHGLSNPAKRHEFGETLVAAGLAR